MRYAVVIDAVSNSQTVASPSCLAVFLPKRYEETPMSGSLMQYTCCYLDIIYKTSYTNKP